MMALSRADVNVLAFLFLFESEVITYTYYDVLLTYLALCSDLLRMGDGYLIVVFAGRETRVRPHCDAVGECEAGRRSIDAAIRRGVSTQPRGRPRRDLRAALA